MATYRVGVIGCRGIGERHASGLLGLGNAALAAACDLEETTLNAFKERWHSEWPDLNTYSDHRDMLAKEDLDIVTVATSDHRHADLVVDAANAGVSGIFCEKPLATNLADADRMVDAAERNGAILSVDHTRRFQPLWRHIKEQIVDAGGIGAVQYVVGALNGPRSMLFRNGTHLVDSICYFADSEPDWVFAELEAGYEDYTEYRGDGGHDPATEPSASGYIHFANGVRGFFAGGSKVSADPKFRCEIVGATGYVDIGRDNAVLVRGSEREGIRAPEWPVSGIPAGVQELVRLVDVGGRPVSPAKDAHRVVEILIGFLESQRLGNVRVDLPIPPERRGV
ncbi:MAG: Gfo/Idh/MocA family oxidoreductase [Gemmatimonadota bacterium]|nr:Gfo/Idh/MocA family oxidoreductase [Gemmatimonadota bacterium]